MNLSSKTIIRCPYGCGSRFYNRSYYAAHISNCTRRGDREFRCSTCDNQPFKTQELLENHYLSPEHRLKSVSARNTQHSRELHVEETNKCSPNDNIETEISKKQKSSDEALFQKLKFVLPQPYPKEAWLFIHQWRLTDGAGCSDAG